MKLQDLATRCFKMARAGGIIRYVVAIRCIVPILCLGIAGPFFEIWSSEVWLWIAWVFLILLWSLAEFVLWGQKLVERGQAEEQARNTAGLLSSFARCIDKRRQKHLKPEAFRSEVRKHQEGLLGHLVSIIALELGQQKSDLSANWMSYSAEDESLTTQFRDRPVENRPETHKLKLDECQGGACAAVRDRAIYIESDTQEEEKKALYGKSLPYRSFISVPIFLGDRPLGVLNVDSVREYNFSEDLEWRIKEIGYIIAIGEIERQNC